MDEQEISGFEDGSILQGSSSNLSEWWEEHCRDYQNRIVAPEQYNSENLRVDPTEHGVL
jgi:hypothetical protein